MSFQADGSSQAAIDWLMGPEAMVCLADCDFRHDDFFPCLELLTTCPAVILRLLPHEQLVVNCLLDTCSVH
jgi:hypothetical protein